MARSFLFPQDSADPATTRLIAAAAQFTGFMKGEPGPALPGWYAPQGDNSAFLGELLVALRAAYPQAGPAFGAVRLWTNLTWQPIYLAFIAVHVHGAVPSLLGLTQRRRGIYVDGYRLRAEAQSSGTTEEMLEGAAQQLRALSETMLEEVNALAKLRPIPAQRLVAERVLSLLVRLARKQPDLSNEQIRGLAQLWLGALDMEGRGELEAVGAPDGTEVLIVRRKGCCLDYLITPDRLCSNCPRQDEEQRRARQLADAVAERG
jgi:siderophore ferric iron reductase